MIVTLNNSDWKMELADKYPVHIGVYYKKCKFGNLRTTVKIDENEKGEVRLRLLRNKWDKEGEAEYCFKVSDNAGKFYIRDILADMVKRTQENMAYMNNVKAEWVINEIRNSYKYIKTRKISTREKEAVA